MLKIFYGLALLLQCALTITLVLHITMKNRKKIKYDLLAITVVLAAAYNLAWVCVVASDRWTMETVVRVIKRMNISGVWNGTGVDILCGIAFLIAAILFAVFAWKYVKKRHTMLLRISSVVFGAICNVACLYWLYYLSYGYRSEMIGRDSESPSLIYALCVVLWIATSAGILCVTPRSMKEVEKMSEERALQYLKKQHLKKRLTQEEYEEYRRQILSKI